MEEAGMTLHKVIISAGLRAHRGNVQRFLERRSVGVNKGSPSTPVIGLWWSFSCMN